ncbi:hypothetical protein [Mesorhizobium sp. M6A.T.Ce.TU.016.01.1.1]|uniref:hypothetical protein n=1 Tax=Mesorhizobium sp. M6A.T.Ce.TU.016.01.1.1 TaxID=2496783 RepID=UPI000FCC7B82|nr:hypothetical protein [Mesorhizobium sp. M6A.T.Ce.TU.016.01.1.1]RUU32395.1 hypothetical protein EOC94_02750 [Mesorhizobium sp. M6A.T.Ce.TU.016.01.1.1]
MHVLTSAQPFGFGPAAKLVGLVGHLAPLPVTFVGRGIALRFVRLNDEHFTTIAEYDLANSDVRGLVAGCAVAISVMEPNLVFACVRAGRPVHFFDSLFGFWQTERSLEELSQIASVVRAGSDIEAEQAFRALPVHQAMLVSHLIATGSYVQTLPGVAERTAMLARLGVETITATGPMIDVDRLRRLGSKAPTSSRTLLVNLGGFTNTFLDYERRGSYINIILRWLIASAESNWEYDEILVCSGAFAEPYQKIVNKTLFRVGMLPHVELLDMLATRPVYLAAPGLTSLHEAVPLCVPVMLLPDAHYGHTHNRRSLGGTQLARHASTFSDLGLATDIPDADLEGTRALAEVAAAIDRDASLFQQFAAYMDDRLASFRSMTPNESDRFVHELAALLSCTPIAGIMSEIKSGVMSEIKEGTRDAKASNC